MKIYYVVCKFLCEGEVYLDHEGVLGKDEFEKGRLSMIKNTQQLADRIIDWKFVEYNPVTNTTKYYSPGF